MSHNLSSEHVLREVYDPTTGSLKTTPSNSTSFEIEVSADDGDSVLTRKEQNDVKVSLDNTNSGVIIPAFQVSGKSDITLYTKTTSTITGPQLCSVQVSPSLTDDVWLTIGSGVTPSTTLDVVVMSSNIQIVAKRVRVIIASSITSGSFDLYVVTQ